MLLEESDTVGLSLYGVYYYYEEDPNAFTGSTALFVVPIYLYITVKSIVVWH